MREPRYGWYGAGWNARRGGRLVRQLTPPLDDPQCLQEFLEGFYHAHQDYCEDCPSQGFPFDAELLRVAALVYVAAHELDLLPYEED